MIFGSICSGIEAASIAWRPLGWKAAWLSEIDPFPATLLAHHYPGTPNLGDMTTIAHRVLAGDVPAPDILAGGTPCQAFSVAGLRESLSDARGNLTLKFVELADAIDHVRAGRGEDECIIFWENVPGVLSTKDNAFGCFLAGLAGEDDPLLPPGARWSNAGCVLGPARAVAWRTLDAQYFGLAQRRRRVFVVASARNGFDPAQVLFEWEGMRRDTAPSREPGEVAATCTLRSTQGGSCVDHAMAGHIQAFGGNRTSDEIEVSPALLSHPGSGWKGDFESETFLVQPVAFHPTQDPIHSVDGSTHGLGCGSSGGQASIAVAYTTKLHNTASNNAGKIFTERTAALDANIPPPALLQPHQVRRLTPTECERLQGFPDGYTAIPWRGKPATECPDGPRYKALGNSWAVPVAAWIGRRINEQLKDAACPLPLRRN